MLASAFALAESAHRSQRRATDGRPFLDHVTEVAKLLDREGFGDDLVAVGLLHDAVERGTLQAEELEAEMGEEVTTLVMALSEDPSIEPFEARKSALRDQVALAGPRAMTVFAADKLSDIRGLRRGIRRFGEAAVEERIGTKVSRMAGHYRGSVELIERCEPATVFLPELRIQLLRLSTELPQVLDRSDRASEPVELPPCKA